MSTNHVPLPHLPQEIITNILTRLPVQSLLKFKSVSKPWLSLISSPLFAKLQLQQMKLTNSLSLSIFISTSHSFYPQHHSHHYIHHKPIIPDDLQLVGSIDGLICGTVDFRYPHFVVFNPIINEFREIPEPNIDEKGRYFCGFGYDSKIDDYKILRGVIFSFFDDGFCIEVFNLKGNSWRTIQTKHWCGDSFDEEGVLLGDLFEGEGILLNGVLHWVSSKDNQLIRFDLSEEIFLEAMPIPIFVHYARDLIVIDECLCLYDLPSESFLAYKLMDYRDQNSWEKVYVISTSNFPEYCSGFLCVTENGHLVFDIDRDYMILYNPEDDDIEEIGEEECDEKSKIVYMQSLISPTR